jgi:hypothetical protein
MWNSFTGQSNGLPPLDVQGNFRRTRRAHITLSRSSSVDDRAGLSARLERLYDDLGALGGRPVGESIADVYNALLRDMTNTFAASEDELKPFRQVTRDMTADSVRLLVGQLRVITSDD